MKISSITAPVALAALVVLTSACAGSTFAMKDSGGPERVDELLTRVERVQADAVLAKERTHETLDALEALTAKGFDGDPVAAHAELVQSIDKSEDQAESLDQSIRRMKQTADKVYKAWMNDLESFGNTKLRQRSQERLADSRMRYEAVLNSAIAVQIAYSSLNSDFNDHALFLENDFNADSVAMIAGEVDGLGDRSKELDQRVEACSTAAKSYVESSALPGQIQDPSAASKEPSAKETEGSR